MTSLVSFVTGDGVSSAISQWLRTLRSEGAIGKATFVGGRPNQGPVRGRTSCCKMRFFTASMLSCGENLVFDGFRDLSVYRFAVRRSTGTASGTQSLGVNEESGRIEALALGGPVHRARHHRRLEKSIRQESSIRLSSGATGCASAGRLSTCLPPNHWQRQGCHSLGCDSALRALTHAQICARFEGAHSLARWGISQVSRSGAAKTPAFAGFRDLGTG